MPRFVPIPPEIIGANLGSALELYVFLVEHETSAGVVWYGKPIGYAWIHHHWHGSWEERPKLRSLQRYMAVLRDAGFVSLQREFHGGIVVRLPRSLKFAKGAPPPLQLSLLSPVAPIRKRAAAEAVDKQWKTTENPKNNTAKFGGMVPPKMAG